LDFTVTDPLAQRYQKSNPEEGGAAGQAERGKSSKYGQVVGGVGVTGRGLELYGRLRPNLDGFLRRLAGYARAERAALGQEATRHLHHWQLQISIALARFTAAAIADAHSFPVHCRV